MPSSGGAITLAVLMGIVPAVARGQTRFQWPDTNVDVARYTSVGECLGAVQRVRTSLEHHDALTVDRDTMPRDPLFGLRPAPAEVTETATRCAARFSPQNVDLVEFRWFLRLLLAANRDSDAAVLVDRKLGAMPVADARARAILVDTAVGIYLDVRPVRLAAAETFLVQRARGGVSRIDQLGIYDKLRRVSHDDGDTARARRVARWELAIADSLPAAERQSQAYAELGNGNGGDLLIYGAAEELAGLGPLLDSLRHSTAAFAAFEGDLMHRATGGRPDKLLPIGQPAQPLSADWWFPSGAGAVHRPAHGRVTLVSFLDFPQCVSVMQESNDGQCNGEMVRLARIARRFPTVDITVVASTQGGLLYLPPMSPTAEASLIAQWVETFHLPNLVLAVDSTPFWRLPEPDGRRINKDVPNLVVHRYGVWRLERDGRALIDENGLIVDVLHVHDEDEIMQFLDVLVHRPHTGN